MSSKAIATLLLIATAMVLIARALYAPALKTIKAHSLSGTYSFRASLGNPSFLISGHLDFDWLGDISGEARVTPRMSSGKSVPDRCDLLIAGTYSPSEIPRVYNGSITLTAVPPDCPVSHGREQRLGVRIVQSDDLGHLIVTGTSPPEEKLAGFATPRSPGPV